MERRLREVLEGNEDNYILPFLWHRGEEEAVVRKEIRKIRECGIRAFCLESRPHPDFLGDRWWKDMDAVLDEAGKQGMKVWLLDDARFPSGFAGGMVEKFPEYGKRYLTHYCVDCVGPQKKAVFFLKKEHGDRIMAVLLAKREKEDIARRNEVQDVTDRVREGILSLELLEGLWTLTVVLETSRGGGREEYINPIDRESVRFFIRTVYEPHYRRYRDVFGEVFAGFFSDEPEMGNQKDYTADGRIGSQGMDLPWSPELEFHLKNIWGAGYGVHLLGLWYPCEGISENARLCYMDEVSRLYEKNFSRQIGEWCRKRGVRYIGHVIEDRGSHARLGVGCGHYFRAMDGQDWAGVDVVLQQLRPEMDFPFYRNGGRAVHDGRFYHYGLAKLAVSSANMDAEKKGDTVCEIFGAYGWTEGLPMMTWMASHMMVQGINHFVPHAFSMRPFPDPDCPPHFYAEGYNPQYYFFKTLMTYMNRVCHLIQGGRVEVRTGILYHARQEWIGETEPLESVGEILAKEQMDYLIISEDYIKEWVKQERQTMAGGISTLILPACRYVDEELGGWLEQVARQGIQIVCMDRKPEILLSNGWKKEWEIRAACCSPGDAVDFLRRQACWEIRPKERQPWLRCYHYIHDDGEYILFFNEQERKEIKDEILWRNRDKAERYWWYDPWNNELCETEWGKAGLLLHLYPMELKILYLEEMAGRVEKRKRKKERKEEKAHVIWQEPVWQMKFCKAGEQEWKEGREETELNDLSDTAGMETFSGLIQYETAFRVEKECGEQNWEEGEDWILDLGEVGEAAEVWINGEKIGQRIAPPYRFELKGHVRKGKNTLQVIVANSLVHRQRDRLSATLPMGKTGLLGPVRLERRENI